MRQNEKKVRSHSEQVANCISKARKSGGRKIEKKYLTWQAVTKKSERMIQQCE